MKAEFDCNDGALIEKALTKDRRGHPIQSALKERMWEFTDR